MCLNFLITGCYPSVQSYTQQTHTTKVPNSNHPNFAATDQFRIAVEKCYRHDIRKGECLNMFEFMYNDGT